MYVYFLVKHLRVFSLKHWSIMTLHLLVLQHISSENKSILLHNHNIIITFRKLKIGILVPSNIHLYSSVSSCPTNVLYSCWVFVLFLIQDKWRSCTLCSCHVSFNQNLNLWLDFYDTDIFEEHTPNVFQNVPQFRVDFFSQYLKCQTVLAGKLLKRYDSLLSKSYRGHKRAVCPIISHVGFDHVLKMVFARFLHCKRPFPLCN